VIIINCLEYVIDNLTELEGERLKEILINKAFYRDKQSLKKGDKIIFTYGFHVGFATLHDYYELVTNECSENEIFSRTLSLFDDRLKIAIVKPKIKKGRIKNDSS